MNDLKWIKISNFPHSEGLHCESTSIRNYLGYLGMEFSEAMVFGLDATIGFLYWKFEPEFPLGGKQKSFTSNSLLCKLLGVQIDSQTFQTPKTAWEDAKNCLDAGVPVLIQGDMGYFPWEAELGFHFGGHLFNLIGYSQSGEKVLLSENNFDQPKDMPRLALEKARNSKEGNKYLWPHNIRYLLKLRDDGKKPPFPAAVKLALQTAAKQMLASSTNYEGLAGMKHFFSDFQILNTKWKEEQLDHDMNYYSDLFFQAYGFVEEYGTGGALFRNLYYDFITELISNNMLIAGNRKWSTEEIDLLKSVLPTLDIIRKDWTNIAQKMKIISEEIQQNGNSKMILEKLDSISIIGESIITNEAHFWSQILKIRL